MKFESERSSCGKRVERSMALMRGDVVGHTSRPLNSLERLKSRMLDELIAAETNAELIQRLQRAADESASLAWATPFPLLMLPELLVEKGREALRQFERQQAIQSRGRRTILMAA